MKNILVIIFIAALIGAIVWFLRDDGVREGYVEVEKQWLDSLQELAEKPPERDTIHETDTVFIEGETQVVEVKEPIYIDAETNFYRDTLSTEYFDVHLRDTLRGNQIVWREFTYNAYMPERTVRITEIQKVPYPYEVEPDLPRLYGGVNAGLNIVSADLNLRLGENNFIGVGTGFAGGEHFIYARYMRALW